MTPKMFINLLALLIVAMPIYAADGQADMPKVAALISMAIASGLCGLGQGKAIAAAAEGIARNPGAFPSIRFSLILGLALIESLALYVLVLAFLTFFSK